MSNYLWVSELYTPLETALTELADRRKNADLVERVKREFARQPSFPELGDEPRAIMSPPVLTPNLETISFHDIGGFLPVRPLVCEFTKDKFVHLNVQKRCLGHLTFLGRGPMDQKKSITESMRITDFNESQSLLISQARTYWHESLVDFHHRLAHDYFKEKGELDSCDFSDWYKASKEFEPEFPYLRFLGLFMTEAILFANFTTSETEKTFTQNVVVPAFRELTKRFGTQPLIVPLEPMETDDTAFWCYYPEEILEMIRAYGI